MIDRNRHTVQTDTEYFMFGITEGLVSLYNHVIFFSSSHDGNLEQMVPRSLFLYIDPALVHYYPPLDDQSL